MADDLKVLFRMVGGDASAYKELSALPTLNVAECVKPVAVSDTALPIEQAHSIAKPDEITHLHTQPVVADAPSHSLAAVFAKLSVDHAAANDLQGVFRRLSTKKPLHHR